MLIEFRLVNNKKTRDYQALNKKKKKLILYK